MNIHDIGKRLGSTIGLMSPYREIISFQLSPKDDLPIGSATITRELRQLFKGTEFELSAGYEEGETTYFDVSSGDRRRYKGIVRNMTNSVFPIIDVLIIDVTAAPDPLAKLLVGTHSLAEWKDYYLRNVPDATLVETDSPGAFMIEFPYPDSGAGETLSVKYFEGELAILDKEHPNGTFSGNWRQIGWEVNRIISDRKS
ncbi:MAG: hypothetical protein HGA31_00250 [Candidatus Moranbacteria bacterium]|nr:hypothetical protein [Candidatus Moranbacteria bacterium]